MNELPQQDSSLALHLKLERLEKGYSKKLAVLRRELAQLKTLAKASPESRHDITDSALAQLSGNVEFSLADLAKVAIKYNACDIIVRPHSLPYTYLEGELIPIGQQALSPIDAFRVTMQSLEAEERRRLLRDRSFVKLVEYHATRFILQAYFERGELAVYARRLLPPPLSLEQLDLPRALEVTLLEQQGLMLLCGGPQAALKKVAYALLQPINQQRRVRIFTLEEQICYELPDERGLLSQLQRGVDIARSTDLLGLKPDILFVEQLKSSEDLQVVLSLANEGALVLVSCPSSGCLTCLQHILELAGPQQRLSLFQIAQSLLSILCCRQHQVQETLSNSAKVKALIERGDLAALQHAVEPHRATPRSAPAPIPGLAGPAHSKPPQIRSASVANSSHPEALRLEPVTEATRPVALAANMPTQPSPPKRPLLQSPPTNEVANSGEVNPGGGEEETLLGWL